MTGTRAFVGASTLDDGGLALALAPGLAPGGPEASPSFFHGFATHPQVLARSLVTLADVTATRYVQPAPSTQRDPVLTAQGDRLRAEVFSACNGVYARLDLLGDGLDGGEIGSGTTNVDLGPDTRRALTGVGRADLLHLDVGVGGLRVATPGVQVVERPVEMPPRWVRALGNAAELHHGLAPVLRLDGAAARSFVASLPAATSTARSGWLTAAPSGARLAPRRSAGSVHVSGLHRLAALKRLLVHVRGVTVYGPADGGAGPALVEVALPGARVSVGLTAEPWRGHSGEGSLLDGLAAPEASGDADLVAALLAFEPVVDVARLARDAALDDARVRAALAVLAAQGRVGWDAHDAAWFHRELPDDPGRPERDNPRLRAARALAASGGARPDGDGFLVRGSGGDHRVRLAPGGHGPDTCTCTWYLRHGGDRGPCQHVLAARLGAAAPPAQGRSDDERTPHP
ncbi:MULTISPECIES: SWIM zinc finger family protein [unclassified Isoptericola]|uniref:SWIM zinc finger family protein n=1 Tax=unclassified Isoptericola TaxID=2623355 RepID=UPI003662A4F4